MRTREKWIALSGRVRSLVEAGQTAANLFSRSGTDSLGVMVDLGEHAKAIRSDLLHFRKHDLDKTNDHASQAIDRVSAKIEPMLNDNTASSDSRQIFIRSAIAMLGALEGEVTYLLARNDEDVIRSRAERAFVHLNRSIMVDEALKTRWQWAHGEHETECERLGAVHLLAHGIWAFKAHADGGRTDLVFQEPLENRLDEVQRTGDGLVLTEWKRHQDGDDAARFFQQARGQSTSYAAGVLGGTELRTYRYAIVVSKHEVKVPDDLEANGVVYRHINIVVHPRTPSKQNHIS